MHADERAIGEGLVRRLLGGQFPDWAGLPLRRIEPGGTVNVIFRLGDELAMRLPRRDGPTEPDAGERDWLPRLAPLLPVEIPVPVAQGRPTADYPWFWEIHAWLEGETVPVDEIDAIQAAHDLAALVGALQQVEPAGAPPGRIPLGERDEGARYWLARFAGDPVVTSKWERALAAPPWAGPPDLAPRRPRCPQLDRPGRAHQRCDRLGRDGRRRSGVRRDGRLEAAFACRP